MGSNSTYSLHSFICSFRSLSRILTIDFAYAGDGSNNAIYFGTDQTPDNGWPTTRGKLELASLRSSVFTIYWVFSGEKIKERINQRNLELKLQVKSMPGCRINLRLDAVIRACKLR